MPNFATIELANQLENVTYYTVRLNDEEHSLFEKFILRHLPNQEIHDEYHDLMAWLKSIGNSYYAECRLFRHERSAVALPPERGKLSKKEKKEHPPQTKLLRLYTLRLTDNIVFLFDGDVKTADTAQECDVVRPHFNLANTLSEKIDEAITNKEITINHDDHTLVWDPGFDIIY